MVTNGFMVYILLLALKCHSLIYMKLAICSSSEKIGTTNWNLTVPLIHKTCFKAQWKDQSVIVKTNMMYKLGIHWLSAIYPLLGKFWAFRGYFPALHSSAVLELQTSLYMTCSLDHSLMSAIFLFQCHAGKETCHKNKM